MRNPCDIALAVYLNSHMEQRNQEGKCDEKTIIQYAFDVLHDAGIHARRIGVMIRIYTCESCGFLFQRSSEVSECPTCDRRRIRPATEQEKERLLRLLNQQRTNQLKGGE